MMDEMQKQLSESYDILINKLSAWLDAVILQLPNLVIAGIIAIIAFFLSKYIRRIAVKGTKKFTKNETVLNLISSLTSLFFGVFVIFIILGIFDLSETINRLLATAGVVGLAIGLALQDPMTNLFSGVFLSVRDLYKIGDLVETNGYFGTITNIDLRLTKLRIATGQEVVIPNKDVIQSPLKNYTNSRDRRIDLSCGISYGEDLDSVQKIATETISELPGISKNHKVEFFFTEFDNSSINFLIRYWINNSRQKDYLAHKSKGIIAIKKAFDKNNINIPFPIRTLDFGSKGGVEWSGFVSNNDKFAVNAKTKN